MCAWGFSEEWDYKVFKTYFVFSFLLNKYDFENSLFIFTESDWSS